MYLHIVGNNLKDEIFLLSLQTNHTCLKTRSKKLLETMDIQEWFQTTPSFPAFCFVMNLQTRPE